MSKITELGVKIRHVHIYIEATKAADVQEAGAKGDPVPFEIDSRS